MPDKGAVQLYKLSFPLIHEMNDKSQSHWDLKHQKGS